MALDKSALLELTEALSSADGGQLMRKLLHTILQARGIDTLIITGTATQVGCESTARDAMKMNYKVFFITDGNATFTDAEHDATLSAMAHGFCDVIDTNEMIATIAAARLSQPAAA